MKLSLIAEEVGGRLKGDRNYEIKGISGIKEANLSDITFYGDKRYKKYLRYTNAGCIILSQFQETTAKNIIIHPDPFLAIINIAYLFSHSEKRLPQNIEDPVVLRGKIGENIGIGPFSTVEENADIGDNVRIGANVYIGKGVKIRENTLIYPGVKILEGTEIGNGVIIHSGVVIGSDGFGYINRDDKHIKIPQIGKVIIEDEVEIGSNTTIDRGTFGDTIIGKGTKIDNLVQIGHNVKIGKNCIIIAQTGIGGSAEIGDNVIIAGQVGIVDHIKIGDGAKITAKSAVTKSVPPYAVYSGIPARERQKLLKALAFLFKSSKKGSGIDN